MEEVNDHLKKGLKIIFIGFNPGITSSETGHHYAHPTNRFYKLLYEAGLTPRLYEPAEDHKLLKLGYGLTNIVQRPTKSAQGIKSEEYDKGRKKLIKKLEKYKPEVACFTGIGVYKEFSQKSNIKRGLQPDSHVRGVKEFVISSPSGLNRTPYQKQLKMYKKLKELLE
ncbi:MAG TPA: mismatch-specific DNA-glycosylase [Halanaerobiales bacterium]|nr:mismatch-specific DNA-glycosylase [Halanaerobiales bacterium]